LKIKIILKILIIMLAVVQAVFAQDTIPASSDTLSAVAKNDSAAAAYKLEALKQALGGDSYQPAAPIANYQPPDFGNVAIRMAVGLGVILILLYVLYILAKKVRKVESPLVGSGQSVVQLLDSKFLGSGRHIFLIKVGMERVLIVGASAENMRTLSEIQGEEAKNILEIYGSKPVTAAQFSATVDHLLRRFRREGGT
jgi:flagellar biogenesis protein FliO